MNSTAVVVGGGIGGLAGAGGLTRAGWQVTVLERAQVFTEVGAGIVLGVLAYQPQEAGWVWARSAACSPASGSPSCAVRRML
jgi:2-polyprenyl-6-methoxyphenol hydroxylase-like FAD-dependent oxidoreductase